MSGTPLPTDQLPLPVRLAWSYARKEDRPKFASLFLFDHRLNAVVTRAREPLLGQLRLAWWRDRLSEPRERRPVDEPLLAALAPIWDGQEQHLLLLLDAFEGLLLAKSETAAPIAPLAQARADTWVCLAHEMGVAAPDGALQDHAMAWSAATVAACDPVVSDGVLARKLPSLTRRLRPFAVLGGMGRHALLHNESVLGSRSSIANAWRIGLAGR